MRDNMAALAAAAVKNSRRVIMADSSLLFALPRRYDARSNHPRFASNSLMYSTRRFTPSIGMAL